MMINQANQERELDLSSIQTGKARDIDITLGYQCCVCGKKLTPGQEYKSVHLLNTGNITTNPDRIEDSQGSFPVGSECMKRIPKEFLF